MKKILIDVLLEYGLGRPGSVMLMVDAAEIEGQTLGTPSVFFGDASELSFVVADEGIGTRVMMHCESDVTYSYRCEVTVTRPNPEFDELTIAPIEKLPGDAVRYTLPSRFCEVERFQNFVEREFGKFEHGAKVAAIRGWIEAALEYVPGSSGGATSAAETFIERRGVCRDYAHLMVAMCRAVRIPARYCSVYAPSVVPQDFHAVTQVFLSGEWHLVDATGMATADEMAIVAVGRDATDVAFMTTTGPAEMRKQFVSVV